MLSRDSEDEIWSRFVFELVIWPQEVTLVRWTQPSGPLCLWQCLDSSSTTSAICPPTILLPFLAPQVQEPSSTTPSTCTCALQGHTGANVCARLIDTKYSLIPEVLINPGVLVSGLSHLNSKQAITFTTSLTNFPEQNNTSDLKCHLHKIQRR